MKEEELVTNLQLIINRQNQSMTDPEFILQAALAAYQNARIDGLCHEGAYEIALQEIQRIPNRLTKPAQSRNE